MRNQRCAMPKIPVLETPRLMLRGWRPSDVDAWAEMNADPRVREFFPGIAERSDSIEAGRRLAEQLARDGFGWWVIEVKGARPFAGIVALQRVPFEAAFTPAFEIGWRLPVDAWGNGYATEGAAAVLRFAFAELGWDDVVAMTAAINVKSQRVMQRLGMTHDARDDFDHPRIEEGSRLRRHVLYRIRRT